MKPYYYKMEKQGDYEFCLEDCLIGQCKIGSVACSECHECIERNDVKNSVTCNYLQLLANDNRK